MIELIGLVLIIGAFISLALFIADNFVWLLTCLTFFAGIIALFTGNLLVAVCSFGLFAYLENYMEKYPFGKPRLMKDSTLDRVRCVQIHFYDRKRDNQFDYKFNVEPDPKSDHYSFYINDGKYMIDPMLEKQSIILYDEHQHSISLDQYYYSWHEVPLGDDDGCLYLHIKRKKAA